ncbi:unknown [Prevotella sp. CAG:617]|nr:unknown [Prevotella sp. CAG:617]
MLARISVHVDAGQVDGTLQVAQGGGPAVTVGRTGQVGLYVDNGFQGSFVLISPYIYLITRQTGIVGQVFLVSRDCSICCRQSQSIISIMLLVTLVQQQQVGTDAVVAAHHVGVVGVYKVGTLQHIIVVYRTENSHILFLCISSQILRAILPGHTIIYAFRLAGQVSGVLRKGGIDHRCVSISSQTRTAVGKERIVYQYRTAVSFYIQSDRVLTESAILQRQ